MKNPVLSLTMIVTDTAQYKKDEDQLKLTQKSEIESLRAELDELKLVLKELTKKQL